MDVAPTQAQAADDQELAKVLESMNNSLGSPAGGQLPTPTVAATDSTESAESTEPSDTPFMADMAPLAVDSAVVAPTTDDASSSLKPTPVSDTPSLDPVEPVEPVAPVVPEPEPVEEPDRPSPAAGGGEFDSIKKEALNELKPLVDKLDLSPEDKFNTLLLIIRSTDDKSLVPKAHEAAKSIDDESKRAAALLDIIKEIDYFSHPAN